MKGIFHPDNYYDWEYPWLSSQGMREIRKLDPVEDRHYLDYIILHAPARQRDRLMKSLGISELPERIVNCDDPSGELYEEYVVFTEQVAREPDAEVLKEAAYEAPTQMARFAFCYLTNYSYPRPWVFAYGCCTCKCGWKEGMTTEDVIEFCREMIEVQGPFAREAKEILADPPKDHNDEFGERMVSHERAVSEPPYVRRQRLAPFPESAEYDQDRAEVLRLEAQGHEALAAGDREKAGMFFMEMSHKSEQLGKYTQRWEAHDDYARCCIAMAEAFGLQNMAVEAAEILRRLIRECPEEKAYREQIKKAEAVYRKTVKETAGQTGFEDKEPPIVFYHSFEPKYAEVFCQLLEERFRERGGKREIRFIWQEAACFTEDGRTGGKGRFVEVLGPSPYSDFYWASDDDQLEIGDICCSDLPTMTALYYVTGNIDTIPPFIDTDNVFPDFLEQGRIKEDVCGLPILIFTGKAGGTEDSETAGDAAGTEASETAGDAAGKTAGFRTFFAFMDNCCNGLKGLDCLDLMMLMTDSDFLFDVCRACNAGDETPHVFPADRTAFARLAEKEPGY